MKKVLYVITSIALSVINAVYAWLIIFLCFCIFAELSGLIRIVGHGIGSYIITIVATVILFVSARIIKIVKHRIHSKKDVNAIEYTGELVVLSFFEKLGKFLKRLVFRLIVLAVLLVAASIILAVFNEFENNSINKAGVWCVYLFLLLTVRFVVLRVETRSSCSACGCKNCIIFKGCQKSEEYYSTYHDTSVEWEFSEQISDGKHTYYDSIGCLQTDDNFRTYKRLDAINKTHKFYDNVKVRDYRTDYQCAECGQKYYKISKHNVESLDNRTPDSVVVSSTELS